MRSTGEVMGVSDRFSIAFAKSQIAAGTLLPTRGRIFLSVATAADKADMVGLARRLAALGFELMATSGTARALVEAGVAVEVVKKLQEGHPNLIDHLIDGLDFHVGRRRPGQRRNAEFVIMEIRSALRPRADAPRNIGGWSNQRYFHARASRAGSFGGAA